MPWLLILVLNLASENKSQILNKLLFTNMRQSSNDQETSRLATFIYPDADDRIGNFNVDRQEIYKRERERDSRQEIGTLPELMRGSRLNGK